MKRVGILGVICLLFMACQSNKSYYWDKQSDVFNLKKGDLTLGTLSIPQVKDIVVSSNIEVIDSATFKITSQFTAKKAIKNALKINKIQIKEILIKYPSYFLQRLEAL